MDVVCCLVLHIVSEVRFEVMFMKKTYFKILTDYTFPGPPKFEKVHFVTLFICACVRVGARARLRTVCS
jgi:hypothetical protein